MRMCMCLSKRLFWWFFYRTPSSYQDGVHFDKYHMGSGICKTPLDNQDRQLGIIWSSGDAHALVFLSDTDIQT
jgi:hypothetical protein